MSIFQVKADPQQQVGKTGDFVQIEISRLSVDLYVIVRYRDCQARKTM